MKPFHELSLEERITISYQQLERMRRPNGGYIASPYNAEDGSGDAYNVFWIRDIMFATYANEYLGCFDKMVESFRLVLDIFKKFHPRIVQASIIKPDVRHQTGQFMPARVHPTTLDTITDAWGHHQLDVYGLFMYKMGDLIKKGYGFRFSREDFTLISHIRNYIFNMGFEADYGMWEEGPEEHSSSFGAVLGGLMMWFDQGFYDYKYKTKIEISHYVPVSERMIADGYKSLMRVLPRESESRPYDMSQLSLIWPYNIVDFDTKNILLHNIETHLLGKHGVRRYPGDVYCGKGLVPGHNETAEWPLGLAWLAICYAKLAEHGHDFDVAHKRIHLDWPQRRAYFLKAVQYFEQLEKSMTPEGCVPEMYLGKQIGHNTPLAWAQSFHIISGQMLINLAAAHPREFKIPHEVRHRARNGCLASARELSLRLPGPEPMIKFGTDGWRAVIAQEFTFANVARVAQATADYWSVQVQSPASPLFGRARKVVIGYDRRFFSDRFARTTAAVFLGNEFEVILTPEPTPTPCVSYAVKQLGAVGGVMITASHNPPIFNGFKLKSYFGGSSGPEECQAVESLLDRNPVKKVAEDVVQFAADNTKLKIRDIRPAHFAAIRRLVDFPLIARAKLRVAHDPLFGVGAGCFASLLAGTNCTVTTLNARHDVLFGGLCPEPLPKNYVLGGAQLRKNPHAICLVTDGDSDRIGAMDGRGGPLTNQQVIALLLHHLVRNRGERGVVTKTFNTTALVDKLCAAWNLPLTEVGIGFRFIAPELMKPGALFGAEESGSVGFAQHIPERDGLAAGLFLLEMLAMEKRSVNGIYARLEKEFGPHRYGRFDAHYPLEKRASLMQFLQRQPPAKLLRQPVTKVEARDGVKFVAADSSWLMLRGSGTEPVLRIYAEAKTDADVAKLLAQGRALLRH